MMYQCFHCLNNSVVWDSDFDFGDYGLEGNGVVHHCHCTNCGAEIDYYVETDEVETKKMDARTAIDLLKIEKECVLRQDTALCCKHTLGCEKCDLVQDTTDITKAYDFAIDKLYGYSKDLSELRTKNLSLMNKVSDLKLKLKFSTISFIIILLIVVIIFIKL